MPFMISITILFALSVAVACLAENAAGILCFVVGMLILGFAG